MIMQQLLPIALRRSTHPKVTSVLVDICKYFNAICSKAIVVEHMERLEKSIVITLCNLEKIFPPSFFTIMIHLVVHLASEAKVAGPVHYRWMYPIERYLLTLKKYVRTLFMVVTTPDQSDHSTDEQDYDHPNLHDINMAGCDGDQTKKKTREQNKDHAEYHPSQGQRFVIKFRNDQIVHDSVARKLNKKCAMVANDFKLLPMDVPWIEQDQKNIDEAMATIQVY
ncbi:hypothetical protein ZOSMA_51G00290 [Zostera marina]|uniref:DUF4218 domain-containing protein n=1 Tax=Zostera marina TaxID=29655 RepID=A0A0K9NXS2_ZOSMR|nr:hypothetical protein ZOSMA_51G00290 [Zostera marina]